MSARIDNTTFGKPPTGDVIEKENDHGSANHSAKCENYRSCAGERYITVWNKRCLPQTFPDPAIDVNTGSATKQTAVLAGGCFWCTEAVFEQIEGVEKVVSGYSGGDRSTANYDAVCTGQTGHAESIQITLIPRKFPTDGS